MCDEPAGLATLITYNAACYLPSEPGTYKVVATVVDELAGSEADYVLGKGPQFINFPAIPNLDLAASGGIIVLPLNAASIEMSSMKQVFRLPLHLRLAVQCSIDNILSDYQPGRVVITAQQLGNEVYAAAEEKVRSFNVTGVAPLGASSTVAKLNDDGTLGITQTGQPFQELGVYSSSDVNGSYDPILKIMLMKMVKANSTPTPKKIQRFFQVK